MGLGKDRVRTTGKKIVSSDDDGHRDDERTWRFFMPVLCTQNM
jgi:hypothetical protein